LAELRTQGVFLFYICLRPTASAGYWPPRTPSIADWATTKNMDLLSYTTQTCALLQECFQQLHDWLERHKLPSPDELQEPQQYRLRQLAEGWYNHVEENSVDFWGRVTDSIKKAEYGKVTFTPHGDDVRKAHDIAAYWRQTFISPLMEQIGTSLANHGISSHLGERRLTYLFVVDEAKELQLASGQRDRFAWFRRALTALPYVKGNELAFAIVTDTTSRVANFTPASPLDPSFRVRDPLEKKELFSPCSVADSVDVWWQSCNRLRLDDREFKSTKEKLEFIRSQLDLKDLSQASVTEKDVLKFSIPRDLLESFEFMSMFGRPAFYAFMQRRGPAMSDLATG
jgi:hypothetical protein